MTFSVRLPREIEERLEKLSVKTGRIKAFYVKDAILEHLDDIKDIYLAEKRLEDIRSGRFETISMQEVKKQYDLDN